jgi:hypothetical protein
LNFKEEVLMGFLNVFSKLSPLAIGIIGVILIIMAVAFVFTMRIKSSYKEVLEDIRDGENRSNKRFSSKVLNDIVKDYELAQEDNVDEINTQAIIEKNFRKNLAKNISGERFVSKANSLMIILGLLGTFYGLSLSIAELVNLLSSAGDTVLSSVDSITGGLINSIKGMSVAFITSLFGIGASIVITLLNTWSGISDLREDTMVNIEEYLDNILGKNMNSVDAGRNDLHLVSDKLDRSFDKFTVGMQSNFQTMITALESNLSVVSGEMAKTAASLGTTVDKFDASLNGFSTNVRDFSEFNHHLKTNIQRMSLSFNDLSEEFKNNAELLARGTENKVIK